MLKPDNGWELVAQTLFSRIVYEWKTRNFRESVSHDSPIIPVFFTEAVLQGVLTGPALVARLLRCDIFPLIYVSIYFRYIRERETFYAKHEEDLCSLSGGNDSLAVSAGRNSGRNSRPG